MSRFNGLRKLVATRRDAAPIKMAAKISRIVLDLVDNARHWNFETNGERLVCLHSLDVTTGPAFDVGGHRGEYAEFIAKAKPGRTVFSFEPLPYLADIARQTLSNYPDVEVCSFGLSDKAGTETIYLNKNNAPTAGTIAFQHDFDPDAAFEEHQCSFETGDRFCADRGITSIGLLKIDVEGMERRVLTGFADMLRSGGIEVIQFEHGPTHAETGDTLRTLRGLLQGLGYDTYAIFPNGIRSLGSVGVDHETFRGRNLLAFPARLKPSFAPIIVGEC